MSARKSPARLGVAGQKLDIWEKCYFFLPCFSKVKMETVTANKIKRLVSTADMPWALACTRLYWQRRKAKPSKKTDEILAFFIKLLLIVTAKKSQL